MFLSSFSQLTNTFLPSPGPPRPTPALASPAPGREHRLFGLCLTLCLGHLTEKFSSWSKQSARQKGTVREVLVCNTA